MIAEIIYVASVGICLICIIYKIVSLERQCKALKDRVDIIKEGLDRLWQKDKSYAERFIFYNSKIQQHADQIISINGNLDVLLPKLQELEKAIIKLKNERSKNNGGKKRQKKT
jgi:chromosome segregation ATPase